jgi:alkaline phosphatase D
VAADSAIVWLRTAAPDRLTVTLRAAGRPTQRQVVQLTAANANAASLRFSGLAAATQYAICVDELGPDAQRTFRTAAAPDAPAPLRLAFGADVGGQGYGRDVALGFPTLTAIAACAPDAFLSLGDMIYGGRGIPARSRVGNAQVPLVGSVLQGRGDYWAHWRYLHDEPTFARLLATTNYVLTWDDHECSNNFGPGDSWGLLARARDAVFTWNPILGTAAAPRRMYRSLRFGRHCELFVLDCRSHRAPTHLADDAPEPKSMLGDEQREWLLASIAASDATWKVIASSVPLSKPTGDVVKGRDAWADHGSPTGYERELLVILRRLQQLGVRQPLFLTADVHHAEVLQLQPFADDPSFAPLEIVVGPLNAKCFGRDVLDPTLAPRSLFHHAPTRDPASYEETRRLWNFGCLELDANGMLAITIVDSYGSELFRIEPGL